MPNSVLWVILVVIWLFVLVPMVIKRRPEVRKTTDTTLATRVLHKGGRAMRSARGGMASGRHPHDADWEPPVRERRKAADLINADDDHKDAKAPVATDVADDLHESDEAVEDTEQTSSGDDASSENTAVEVADGAGVEESTTGTTGPAVETVAIGTTVAARAFSTDDTTEMPKVDPDVDPADLLRDAESQLSVEKSVPVATGVDSDDDATDAADDDLDDDAYDVDDPEDEYDDLDDEYDDDAYDDDFDDEPGNADVGRRGRGGYDPDADLRRSQKRYQRRRRVMALLAAVTVLAVVLGLLLGTIGWIVTGVAGVALVGYLMYLRRTVRIETRIRRRRMTRLARERRAAQERAQRTEPEMVPRRLRRPGAVVLEIDDEDPVFDHLPTYRREWVERDDLDLRRAVGQ
ncbi:divisome protein SepX/GlpR [Williamsia sterculiae]|uniref:Transmembrane protein n=1 Tax=Williamsia sterculiae TaxID=1344003 RepID=A0A1N7DLT9_9NOCA|nr:gephyrin-like molybdotransferase receptor GlpR [Williamsia sterculiae]SIR76698.1 hypothetical protein SAMN05445060_0737 [Williamsia sterculiae]